MFINSFSPYFPYSKKLHFLEVIVFKAGVLERTLDEFEGEDGGMRGDTNMTTIARTCESFQGVSSAHLAVCKEPSVP